MQGRWKGVWDNPKFVHQNHSWNVKDELQSNARPGSDRSPVFPYIKFDLI